MTWINISKHWFLIIFIIMTREIEIEISNQSDVVLLNILKRKKHDVQKLIDDLLSLSSNYNLIIISYRDSVLVEEFQNKSQISFALFSLFFCSSFLEIMIKHINIKTSIKRIKAHDHVRSWKDITFFEIDAFIEILLYMSISFISRVFDYWNLDSKQAINVLIIDSMSCKRWEQIKRYLKIFNLTNDQQIDTRDSHWWKKLKSLTSNFRNASKKYWTSDNQMSIDQ